MALVDADFLWGDAAIHIGLVPERTILDLVPHIDALDAGLVEQVMLTHPGGLHVLARPNNPEQAEALTGENVRTVLSSLAQMYDDIVIDTPEAVTVTCHEDGPVRAQLREPPAGSRVGG